MRIIFAGTPEFAAKALEALIQSEHEVVMVLSQPDRPAGRGRKLKESAVKALAKQHHIPVYTPLSLRVLSLTPKSLGPHSAFGFN